MVSVARCNGVGTVSYRAQHNRALNGGDIGGGIDGGRHCSCHDRCRGTVGHSACHSRFLADDTKRLLGNSTAAVIGQNARDGPLIVLFLMLGEAP